MHPQCDASEFLEQLQHVLREGEVAKLAEFGGRRAQAVGVLGDCVFNVMMRSRFRCAKCGHVSDRLDMDSCVRLPIPRDGQRTLEELLGDYFLCERMGTDSKCQQCVGVRSARCHGAQHKQLFMEEEPAVLVLSLVRHYQEVNRRGRLLRRKNERATC